MQLVWIAKEGRTRPHRVLLFAPRAQQARTPRLWLHPALRVHLDTTLMMQLQLASRRAVPALLENILQIRLRHAAAAPLGSTRNSNREPAQCALPARTAQELASQHIRCRARNAQREHIHRLESLRAPFVWLARSVL